MLSSNSTNKNLIDLRISLEKGRPLLFSSFKNNGKVTRHPAYFLRDGAKKLMQVFTKISQCKDGICLLEEPEAFQHPKYSRLMIKIFENAICKNNTQVILCTHSIDFLDDILKNFEELGKNKIEDVSILKTKLEGGKMSAYEYKGKEAVEAREEIGIDLRG